MGKHPIGHKFFRKTDGKSESRIPMVIAGHGTVTGQDYFITVGSHLFENSFNISQQFFRLMDDVIDQQLDNVGWLYTDQSPYARDIFKNFIGDFFPQFKQLFRTEITGPDISLKRIVSGIIIGISNKSQGGKFIPDLCTGERASGLEIEVYRY
ncbi:MAG: hypothetical protein L6422_07840 [Candidatus Marinimicrobia bacterium]|nr:hypothetical protein [bacterium]MCG2716181.1 hypothetical protein [Candidatus Neomarinimicrobiota bacterium]